MQEVIAVAEEVTPPPKNVAETTPSPLKKVGIKSPDNPLAFSPGITLGDDMDKSRREPEEEFFMLSVLSLKMTHTEVYTANDYVYEISASKLYQQVKQLNIPFHKWYNWIETRFTML